MKKNNTLLISWLFLSFLAGGTASAETGQPQETGSTAEVSADAAAVTARTEEIPSVITDYYLAELDNSNPSTGGVSLTGAVPTARLYFPVARDEIIRKSQMEIVFTPSPSLIPVNSHLNVYLNGTLQQVVPVQKEHLGRKNRELIKFDPFLLKDYNELTLELIGHYTDYCENIINSSIWMNISPESTLTLERQKLRIQNDLSYFPLPFINTSSKDSSTLSIVLSDTDNQTLTAAAIFSSYSGKLAGWRGINFPVFFNTLPADGHAVAFITNSSRPKFLESYPEVERPQIEIVDLPHSANANKLLVVSAPDSKGLITVAKAVAAGDLLFNGPKSEIIEAKEIKLRRPYDAPNWINIDEVTLFKYLMEYDEQLSSEGFLPRPINLNLRLPPDIYYAEGSRINLNLKYNYTKPSALGLSQMQFLMNNHIIRSYPLSAENESNNVIENIPLVSEIDDLFNRSKIDPMLLRINNLLTFDFQYDIVMSSRNGECDSQTLIKNHVDIDPRSSVDFTGLYHFTKMPNLNLFWQSGYPFSIYADLQKTAVLIEDGKNETQLSTLFNALARIAGQIGYPATAIRIFQDPDNATAAAVKDLDLLVVGSIPDFLHSSNVKVVLDKTEQSVKGSFNSENPNLFRSNLRSDSTVVRQNTSEGISAVVSFRSPLNEDRTVVALIGDSNTGLSNLGHKLALNSDLGEIHGSVTILRDSNKRSIDVGETYYIGHLPWYQRIWYYLVDSPLLLISICMICAGIFCFFVYRLLSRINRARLLKTRKKSGE